MIFVYGIIVFLGAFLLWKTVRFILLEEKIRKSGISATATVSHIQTVRRHKGPTTDRVRVRFGGAVPGQLHEAEFVARHRRYHSGDTFPVKFLPERPDKIVVSGKRGYWLMLVIAVLVFAFVIFAAYKIREAVEADGRTYGFTPPGS